MKKLSESVWGSIRKKSLGQEVRLEDKLTPVDLGNHCNFYFANKDLDGEFTFDEMKSLNLPSGWRLPTSREFENAVYEDIWVDETLQDNIEVIDDIPNSITFKGIEEVKFDLGGNDSVYYWCDDSVNNGWSSVELGWCPRNSADYYVIGGNHNRPERKRIRLVKDK